MFIGFDDDDGDMISITFGDLVTHDGRLQVKWDNGMADQAGQQSILISTEDVNRLLEFLNTQVEVSKQ